MDIDEAITYILATHPRTAPHFAPNGAAKASIFPLALPANPVLPAVTYQRISDPKMRTLSGTVSMRHPRFQLTVYAQTYGRSRDVAKAVEDAFDGYKVQFEGSDPLTIHAGLHQNTLDSRDPNGLYKNMIDIIFWHST